MAAPKVHPHLATGIIDALMEIFHDDALADRVVNRILKERKKWGARDRRFFAESVYECVRWRRWLWYLAGLDDSHYLGQVSITRENLEKIWNAWRLAQEHPAARRKSKVNRAIAESIPDWLDNLGVSELGNNWDSILSSLNHPAYVYLRTNLIKTNCKELKTALSAEGIIANSAEYDSDVLYLTERKNVFITEPFKKGFFEVQDAGSQRIAPFLGVEPGMRVIDACAGGGGKSLHMASLMENRGKIIALDKNDWRLKPLRERATRAGVDIIETKIITSSKVIKRLVNSADRLLLDVPCSGSGALRRSPDSKWKFTLTEFYQLQQTQQEILQSYCRMVKKGGIMVYSTCSIFPSENQIQVQKFLSSQAGQGWKLEDELSIIPDWNMEPGAVVEIPASLQMESNSVLPGNIHEPRKIRQNCDGFYMARLKQL